VVLFNINGYDMVVNALSNETSAEIKKLLVRCSKLTAHADEETVVKVKDIAANLTSYLESDDGVWPEYRKTVPFDFICKEFKQRLNHLEALNPTDLFNHSYRILESEGFNPEMMLHNNAVRFIGKPKKVAKLLRNHFGEDSLSMIKTDNGGILVKLGSRFEGKTIVAESDFRKIFSETMAAEPSVKKWFGDLIQSAHSFAAEDIVDFGGIPTDNEVADPKNSKPSPSPTPSPTPPSPPTRKGDDKSFPAKLLQIIESTKELWPIDTKDSISEQLIVLDLRPPDPDPPPPQPTCKPLWREMPPDPRMTRIDSYNIVDSGRPSSPDGFGWSVSGLTESNEPETFRKTQLVTWPRFHIHTGQKGVRRVIPEPQLEGWVTNELKPQKCSLFQQGFLLRIPSLSAEAGVVGFNILSSSAEGTVPEQVRFFKDSADGLYMEIQDYDSLEHANCTFTVTQAAPPYSSYGGDTAAGELFSCNLTFADYKSGKGKQYGNYTSESIVLQGQGIVDADRVLKDQSITNDMPIGEVVAQLYAWLYEWFCEDIPRNQPDMIGEYLRTNAGACRHRAYIMFLALNRLGLPCRMVGSTCHAWSEIWNPDTGAWMELDLNGCDEKNPPADCPPCMTKNPFYNIMRDGKLLRCCPEGYRMEGDKCVAIDGSGTEVNSIECEKCIPRVCPEGYNCDPKVDKCVPDCELLHGEGWHYHPERDECVNCANEGTNLEWKPNLQECDCIDCPEGYTMNEDKNCVDENGIISGDAPKGYYFDKELNQCYPKPDCELKKGTIFNPTTGNCECPNIKRIKDGLVTVTVQRWDVMTGKCEEERQCEPGQVLKYDPIRGDYVCVDEDTLIDPTDVEPIYVPIDDEEKEEEDEEDVKGITVDEDAKGTPKPPGERYVNVNNGKISISKPKNLQGSGWIKVSRQDLQRIGRDASNKPYLSVWEYGDLHGVYKWLNEQANKNLISFTTPEINGNYFIAISINPDKPDESKKQFELWKNSIEAVKGGLAKVKIGDGTHIFKLDSKVKNNPPEWKLDFPEGEVWLVQQTQG
jgi:hypothetical protein